MCRRGPYSHNASAVPDHQCAVERKELTWWNSRRSTTIRRRGTRRNRIPLLLEHGTEVAHPTHSCGIAGRSFQRIGSQAGASRQEAHGGDGKSEVAVDMVVVGFRQSQSCQNLLELPPFGVRTGLLQGDGERVALELPRAKTTGRPIDPFECRDEQLGKSTSVHGAIQKAALDWIKMRRRRSESRGNRERRTHWASSRGATLKSERCFRFN